jgi:DNA-directed RNA polymerase specialized sigma24 family protein
VRIRENIFTPLDHAIVRSAVRALPDFLRSVIELRFWQELDISEIALSCGVASSTVELALAEAIRTLKAECLSNKAFSKNEFRRSNLGQCVA